MIKSIYKIYYLWDFIFALIEAVYEQRKDGSGLTGCWWELCYRLVVDILMSAALISGSQMAAEVERGTRIHWRKSDVFRDFGLMEV